MKSINRTNRLSGGPDAGKGKATLFAGEPGGARKIRCPGCQCIAAPSRDNNGKAIIRCPSCGREYRSTMM